MKTTVLVFHPHLADGSNVNAKLANAAREAGIEVRDMYALYPDFTIDVEAEKAVLEAADRIVLQFPMYWYSSPALLKQWEDDVLQYGWAYGSAGTALHGKELVIAVTPGAKAEKYVRDDNNFKYTVTDLLRPLQATNNLIGTTFVESFIAAGASSMSDEAVAQRTQDYVEYLKADKLEALGDYE